MTLKEKIAAEIKSAMKSSDATKLSTLRGLMTAINNKALEKRAKSGKEETLSDEEVLSCIAKEAKKRKEAAQAFEDGGRKDLAEKELSELKILQDYLPEQISEAEAEEIISKILEKEAVKDFGSAMRLAMESLRGKADAKLVSEIVKKKLG